MPTWEVGKREEEDVKAKRKNKPGLRMHDVCQRRRESGDVEWNNERQTQSGNRGVYI